VEIAANGAADLLLLNGQIITMDSRAPRAEALAIRDGRLLAVGDTDTVVRLAGPDTRHIELNGRYVLPGLTDCHVHLASDAARSSDSIECRDFYDPSLRTVADVVNRLQEQVGNVPPGGWVIGRGSPLQDFRLEDGRLPTRSELDSVTPDNPAYIYFGAHLLIANTKAMQLRGVTRDTPSPQGGTVIKDSATGEPTGEFRERAQFLIKAKGTPIEPDELAERIAVELDKCVRRGVTTIHDIVTDSTEIQAYQILARQGRLPVRVHLIVRVIESNFDKWSLADLGLVQGFGSEWLQLGGIKMSIDGGFTGKNAAFSEPLSTPDAHHPGLIRIKQDELDETVSRYHNAGMRICTHAIGDVALDMILESYAKAQEARPRKDHRHRVEHMGNWMMTPERIELARRARILPVPNPPFLYFMGDPVAEMLQRRVTEQGFGFRDLWDAGFPLTFGSDSPGYYSVDPLRDLGVAVARQTIGGASITPGQSLTVEEALRSQTINAAFAGFREGTEGSLEPGKVADVVVLGDDPTTFDPGRFADLPVDVTLSGGQQRFSRQ